MKKSLELETKRRLWQQICVGKTTDCWMWLGETDKDFRPLFRNQSAYRLLYETEVERIPAGWHVHHKCENSRCMNPRCLIALPEHAHICAHQLLRSGQQETLKALYEKDWQTWEAEQARVIEEAQKRELEERRPGKPNRLERLKRRLKSAN